MSAKPRHGAAVVPVLELGKFYNWNKIGQRLKDSGGYPTRRAWTDFETTIDDYDEYVRWLWVDNYAGGWMQHYLFCDRI